jgi:hypothetical protein
VRGRVTDSELTPERGIADTVTPESTALAEKP